MHPLFQMALLPTLWYAQLVLVVVPKTVASASQKTTASSNTYASERHAALEASWETTRTILESLQKNAL